jgi:hypothetical protein
MIYDNMVYIVTDAKAGWDCIISVHSSIESIKNFYTVNPNLNKLRDIQDYLNERESTIYVIHEKVLI